MNPDDLISVLVPVSPVPSHPSTDVLDATLRSIRDYLPAAPVIVMCDGVRAEQEDRAPDYAAFVDAVASDILGDRWGDTHLKQWDFHQHQARMTRATLERVSTPLVLFVEGDCTLWGDIDLAGICAVMIGDRARVVRFHHEAGVLAPHEHLNVNGGKVEHADDVPLISTAQWSQRPHLARADYYRWLLGPRHFHPDSRTMIEDVVHGSVQDDWRLHGTAGWDMHRLFIYAAEDEHGSIKHSETCDGRQDDPKYPMNLLPPPGGPTFDQWKAEK